MFIFPTMYGLVGWINRKPEIYGNNTSIDLSNLDYNVRVMAKTNSGTMLINTGLCNFTTTSTTFVTVTGYGIEFPSFTDYCLDYFNHISSSNYSDFPEFSFADDILCRFAEEISNNPCFPL